ncbi:alpha amylase catalytic region [Cellulophaga algicola DSM 14237]|uniref:Alpha amylase catalytic region n=1 Tax=Cellulophaga algicola (strain DSM 14237 / IC166 / ACAM 630) TaxID=688270 RepID=E6X9P9_CELAD|nr:alpha-amylase family glycosyl hydrolase [Cellulophaga algicola]ADV49819.1 alpha amylase catalytic region [Cellulophaga algicola DSM 14237]
MKKTVLLLFLMSAALGFAQQQNVSYAIAPEAFAENEEITITVSDLEVSTWGVSEAYLWAWSLDANGENTVDSPTNGSWTSSNEDQKLTDNGDGTFSFTLTPATFFNRTNIGKIGILVKAKNGDGDKKTQDFIFNVGTFQFNLITPTETTTVLNAGEALAISATASLNATFVLKANGLTLDTQAAITEYSYAHTVSGTTNFILEVTSGTETKSRSFTAIVAPTVEEAPVPANALDGINLDPTDATKATLVLYAPGKDFVHLIGDFNNWQVSDAYLLKKDSSKDRFWIELSNLTAQTNHLYQYLVEFDLKIADPYSTLILDGYGNDAFIDEVTFPDLPSYPAGQTDAITVLRTGDPEFVWEHTNFIKPKKDDLVIYELLVRDFDARHSFDAVKERLDYLQDLGINAIELMPVNEYDGNESWGYNPAFHMALDKYYGTKDALKALIDECHARGIAVIIDVVYNHASGQHPYYRMWNTDNGGSGGQAAMDNPFFNQSATHSYSVFNDFNHQSQATKEYVNRTLTYWIEEFKIDGMRWDLTKGFTQNCSASDENCTNSTQQDRITVLQEYADTQWLSDDNFYVIFEHLGALQEEEQWADYRIDEGKGILLWNKQTEAYNEATLGFNSSSNFSGVSYVEKGFKQPSAVSFMESHDEERLMFKNLEFGNSNGSYKVKDIPTALSRMETAGAFFFTVPGPKMIWQFGELGYDVSIDENGRVGNKPIRWEYLADANRKALYETWAKLIDLKVKEPIFETTDFELDFGSTTGLKKIHLALAGAAPDEIKYVTIIGNFGVTAQSIIPEFQETGIWYEFLNENLKYVVTDTHDQIVLAPGEYRIFGDKPTALFPNSNLPDQDHDGVQDADDVCPDTPLGATVNVKGCVVFILPATNFQLKIKDETCSESNNGSITITAVENYEYTATVSGDATGSEAFNTSTSFTDLAAGNYTICIRVEEENYSQCYEVMIGEPEALTVSSKINTENSTATLSLKGADTFYVTVNEKTFTTQSSEVIIALEAFENVIQVKTAKDCQGLYEETIVVQNQLTIYPNPVVNDILHLNLKTKKVEEVTIAMYASSGAQVLYATYPVVNNVVEVNVAKLPKGVFYMRVDLRNEALNFKILK